MLPLVQQISLLFLFLFRMGHFHHLFCFLASVLTGMSLVNGNTLANETDSVCRGPKGEKVNRAVNALLNVHGDMTSSSFYVFLR